LTKQETNKSLTKKGIVGAFWQTSSTLLRILTQFIMLGVLARLISQTDFGYIAFIMILVGFTDLFSRMGIGGAIVQLDNVTKSHIKTGFSLSIIFGTFIGAVFYFLTPFIASFFKMEEIIDGLHFYAFLFPIRSLNGVSHSLLRRELKYALIEKINLFSFVFGYALFSIILAFLDFGYWSLLYSYGYPIHYSLLVLPFSALFF
jgi:PST family polysaccharide transporter